MKSRALVGVFLALASQAWADMAQLSDLDRQVIEFISKHGHSIDHLGYQDNDPYLNELQWYRDLGDKVRPGLMYLLTDEYAGDFRKMANVIYCLNTAPGDHSDILAYARENLPGMLRSEDLDGKSRVVQACLYVLGEHGSPQDMGLIQSFFDYHDYVVTKNAKRQADNLQQRIDAGEFDKKEPRPERRPGRQEKNRDESAGSAPPEEHERTADHEERAPWPWFAGGLAVILLLVWRMIRKRQ